MTADINWASYASVAGVIMAAWSIAWQRAKGEGAHAGRIRQIEADQKMACEESKIFKRDLETLKEAFVKLAGITETIQQENKTRDQEFGEIRRSFYQMEGREQNRPPGDWHSRSRL